MPIPGTDVMLTYDCNFSFIRSNAPHCIFTPVAILVGKRLPFGLGDNLLPECCNTNYRTSRYSSRVLRSHTSICVNRKEVLAAIERNTLYVKYESAQATGTVI